VRFYFRPKTPTQYNNEGVRPKGELRLDGAHCPVPVFFLFDSRKLLSRKDCGFSHGSLAVEYPEIFYTGAAFRAIPFDKVYHNVPVAPEERDSIVFHRHAEVVIPDQVSLEHLTSVFCRSAAERETLINLLPEHVRPHWLEKIRVDTASRLFFKYWTFVETVSMTDKQISLQFNPGKIIGHYHAELKIREKKTGLIYTWTNSEYTPEKVQNFLLKNLRHPEAYDIKFYLDNHLVYFGSYVQVENVPF
jgi:hypothetical protein